MASNIAVARTIGRSLRLGSAVSKRAQTRSLSAVSGLSHDEPMHTNYSIDSVKPPQYWSKPEYDEDPMAYKKKPVSSAHAIDQSSTPPKLSALDSVAISPEGAAVHGRYGELDIDSNSGIPLEYLALLHPAAEGAAALKKIANGAKNGTVLVYGAGDAAAMASVQLASADGLAVVGVVGGSQAGNEEFVDAMKEMTTESGTIVPEEFAVLKANFREVVNAAVDGGAVGSGFDADKFLADFQSNLKEYSEYFPETALSPVPEEYTFAGKEKDRKYFDENISTYLSQFQKGSPSFDDVVLKEAFTKEQYAIFKSKFGSQMTAIITGDDSASEFNPADIVKSMTESPEIISEYLKNQTSADDDTEFIQYEFSTLNNKIADGVDVPKGGPILGAILSVSADLAAAVEAVSKGKSLREKAEALQFLTDSQRAAYSAASSVVAMAKAAETPVVTVNGSLPGFETVEPTNADVSEALSAMEVAEDGSSRLNYFLQVYRASDYPVYADYAIHRSQEDLSGPRQIVVTK
ncbi:hypothetical protein CTEN210_08763 [Chaetoceros tenuissimus]|uniref:Uncharacterized protein n=1 Tax=Chaetoceros tenuissimus TaxID=426638 RepID=A0AAD3CU52_9STRA|nr:hypothetical protein CTEN210_08763 [Chaetoceros tenuissimus]